MTELRRSLFLEDLSLENVNRVMMLLADRFDEIEGRRGTPTFYAPPDLQSNKITNVQQGETDGEALTADLETTDLEISNSRLKVRVDTAMGLQRSSGGIGVRAHSASALTVSATEGLQTVVQTDGGVGIDAVEGLYADEGNIDHNSLANLAVGDVHTQYLNEARHDLPARHGDAVLFDPTWTNYFASSTVVGWSAFTSSNIYYKRLGKLVFVRFYLAGTSNSIVVSFTLPYTAAAPGFSSLCACQDAGVWQDAPGYATMIAASATIGITLTISGATWNGGAVTKAVSGIFLYESA